MIVLAIQIDRNGGVIAPAVLPEIIDAAEHHVPSAGTTGVIISGRLPVWVYAALVHHYHPRPWVGTYDPRLGGGVVVSRHHPDAPAVGTIVPVPQDHPTTTVRIE